MFAFQLLCSLSAQSVRSLHCLSLFLASPSHTLLLSEMYIKGPFLVSEYQLIPRVLSLSLCVFSSSLPSNPSPLTLSRCAVQPRRSEDLWLLTHFDFKQNSIFPCLSSSLLIAAVPFLDRDLLNHPPSLRSNLTSLAFSHARPISSLHLAAPVRLAKSSFLTLSPTFHI